jgi:hypothetical protein
MKECGQQQISSTAQPAKHTSRTQLHSTQNRPTCNSALQVQCKRCQNCHVEAHAPGASLVLHVHLARFDHQALTPYLLVQQLRAKGFVEQAGIRHCDTAVASL